MKFGGTEPRHVVVFDCNIYLDVARLLGPPFSWDKFDTAAARASRDPVPHPLDPGIDSLRAIAACSSGLFAGGEAVEVWTSWHIDKMVRGKASQSITGDLASGHRGLGWSSQDADTLVGDLIHGIAERSGGGTAGECYPDGNPPLDHEDGVVYGACRLLAGDDPLAHVYCVTRDKGFLSAYTEKSLSNHSLVLTPALFVKLVRSARARYSMRHIRSR